MKWTSVYGRHAPVSRTQTYCFQSLHGKPLKWTLGKGHLKGGSVKVAGFWKCALQALLKCKCDLWTSAYLLLWNKTHHGNLRKVNRLWGNSVWQLETSLSLSLSAPPLSLKEVHFHTVLSICFFSVLKRLHDWLKEPLCSQWEVCCHAGLVVFGVTYQPPTANILPPETHIHKHKCASERCHDIIACLANLSPLLIHTRFKPRSHHETIQHVSRSLPHVFPLMRSWVALYPASLEKHSSEFGVYKMFWFCKSMFFIMLVTGWVFKPFMVI